MAYDNVVEPMNDLRSEGYLTPDVTLLGWKHARLNDHADASVVRG
jgi:hypothetical protein